MENFNFIPTLRKKIVVGMSGGVDSSVAAYILKEQGHEVIGLFMRNWEEEGEHGACTSDRDFRDVQDVCELLKIPYFSINFAKEYKDNVFSEFLAQLKLGLTPNPDILCNREIKFKVLLKYVKDLGADYLATGHYCRRGESEQGPILLKGSDPLKDQSYFLYTMTSNILENVLFPIGHLPKERVREIARQAGLSTSHKRDSTGICFIGERKFRDFVRPYLGTGNGDFKTLVGEVVGVHQGLPYYTIGQRKGLGLGGPGEPWFVVGKDLQSNTIYVERGDYHPALYADGLAATGASWVSGIAPLAGQKLWAKIRYRQRDQSCLIEDGENLEELKTRFTCPQRAITPAQSIVYYSGDLCLGGAFIKSVWPSYYALGRALPMSTTQSGEVAPEVSLSDL